MGVLTLGYVLTAVLVTAGISGTLGMAGGLILMGALAFVMPAATALALHGMVQLGSNGWRALIHRRHVRWPIVGVYAVGALVAMGLFSLVAFTPSKLAIYLALGLLPILVWLPERWLSLDASRPPQAFAAGVASTALSLTAGVSGPFNDLFFVRTEMTRHEVVSTKACVQVFGHLAKVLFYGAALVKVAGPGAPPIWLAVAALPLSMLGAMLGARVLERMSDAGFRTLRRWLVTAVGLVYLVQAAALMLPRSS